MIQWRIYNKKFFFNINKIKCAQIDDHFHFHISQKINCYKKMKTLIVQDFIVLTSLETLTIYK